MSARILVTTALLCVAVSTAPRTAESVERDCPKGHVWNANQGSCVKKKIVPKRSPAKKYYLAIKHLEKTIRGARPKYGVSLLRDACRRRYADACTHLGFLYLNGRHVKSDAKTSRKHYERACKLKDPHGCLGVADILSRGILGKVDHRGAIPYLDKACQQSNGKGCYELGERYRQGLGVTANAQRAREFYARAYEFLKVECPAKIATSCHMLGMTLHYGVGTTKDRKQSFAAFKAGCEYGSGAACYRLGNSYYYGEGTPTNRAKSLRMYEKACTKYDSAPACNDAVVVVTQGVGTPADRANLMKWAQRACGLDKRWCAVQGYLYGNGKGGVTDQTKATHNYIIACDHGSKLGCRNAARRLEQGRGVPKDPARAEKLFQRACNQGDGESCGAVGRIYHEADPPKRNRRRAHALFRSGCRQDDPVSCHYLGFQLDHGLDGTGKKKPREAIRHLAKACRLKQRGACRDLGRLHQSGRAGKKDIDEALRLLQKSCDLGYHVACTDVGNIYYHANDVPKDHKRAGAAFAQACGHGAEKPCYWVDSTLGNAGASKDQLAAARKRLEQACAGPKGGKRNEFACVALASIYTFGGHLVAKDPDRGFNMFKDSCARKHAVACVETARLYSFGIGVVQNKAESTRLLTSHCNAGNNRACTILGYQLRKEKSYDESARLFERSCTKGDLEACTALAYAHYTGQGVPWDVGKSRSLYVKACKGGHVHGCLGQAEFSEWGVGVAVDLTKALELYRKACTPTSVTACGSVGRFYELGLGGVEVDLKRAESEYKRACNETSAGASESCLRLARLYEKQGGHPPSTIAKLKQKSFDIAKSVEWAPYGKLILGRRYRDGVTVVKNPKKAGELFAAGCDGYDPLACMSAGDMESGKHGGSVNLEAAAVHYARACAAGVDRACKAAQATRAAIKAGGKSSTSTADKPKVPLKPAPRSGCGCTADPPRDHAPTALLVALAIAFVLVPRRRLTGGWRRG